MKSGLSIIKSAYAEFIDMLFPERCIGCGTRGVLLCDTCVRAIPSSPRETPADINALFDYRDLIIKKAIWNLKYYKRSHLGKTLGKLLYEASLEEISDMQMYAGGQSIWVIPIPLSPQRKKERGYNQAEKIAEGFCACDIDGIFELKKSSVVKNIDTLPQARISDRTKRLKNIKGAFAIANASGIAGRTIIVIDDVTTTGGTLNEVIRILRKAGAKKVYGFAVAH